MPVERADRCAEIPPDSSHSFIMDIDSLRLHVRHATFRIQAVHARGASSIA